MWGCCRQPRPRRLPPHVRTRGCCRLSPPGGRTQKHNNSSRNSSIIHLENKFQKKTHKWLLKCVSIMITVSPSSRNTLQKSSIWNCIASSLVDINTYPYHVSISIVSFPIKPSVVEAAKGQEMVNTSNDVISVIQPNYSFVNAFMPGNSL